MKNTKKLYTKLFDNHNATKINELKQISNEQKETLRLRSIKNEQLDKDMYAHAHSTMSYKDAVQFIRLTKRQAV